MAIVDHFITIQYKLKVDTETGEILETKIVDKSTKKESSKKVDNSTEPKLFLESNKFILNDAAISLMQLNIDDKVDIKYEQQGNKTIPIIGSDSAFNTKGGNKLSKNNSVSYRGIKNEELTKYGSEFNIIKHPTKLGLFMLISGNEVPITLVGDENINSEDIEVNLEDFIDDKDADITEIDASFFKL